MKDYPSIPRTFREFTAHIFDKLDGSNLRWEWAPKKGWYKHGTRTRLFDRTDPIFGEAIDVFFQKLAEPIERVVRDQRWERVVVFTEFWGPQSFAGLHEATDPKTLTLFDVAPHRRGILGPVDFRKLFADIVETPRYLGQHRWTRDFLEEVRVGAISGLTFEGVVGKAGDRHHLIMAKAKTQAWIDKVIARYGVDEGAKLVDS